MKNQKTQMEEEMNRIARIVSMFLIVIFIAVSVVGCTNQSQETTEYKAAIIMPGPISDADWNMLGYEGLQVIEKDLNIEVAFSEKIAVADAERVAREYISEGFNIIIFHGGQFVTQTMNLSKQYPNVTFMMGSSAPIEDLPANVWDMVRLYYRGTYPLGVLAASMTKTNKIGYIAGAQLPDFIAIANSVNDAAKAINPDIEVLYSFTGDQNDPVKGRQAADAMIGEGVDIIINWLNAGTPGVEEAVLAAPDVYMTTFSTDKYERAPDKYLVSMLLDLKKPYTDMVSEIIKGNRSGYYEFQPGSGMMLSEFHNTPDDVVNTVKDTWEKIEKKEFNPVGNSAKLFDE
jgi:basic membrane protein A